jgi:hypothetical protein
MVGLGPVTNTTSMSTTAYDSTVVTGEAEGDHFFFEQELVIENC